MSAPAGESKAGWASPIAWLVSGCLVFETLTGLSIYLLPFSVPNQLAVLLHTVIGLLFLIPLLWYLVQHWRDYASYPMNHYKATGYAALVATLVCVVSGVVVTAQSVFGTRISYAWDLAHIVSTFALIGFTLPHVVLLALRERKRPLTSEVRLGVRRFGWGTLWTAIGSLAAVAVAIYLYTPTQLDNQFPPDYSYKYGEDRPFAPSLASTESGGALDSRALSGSDGCGTSGCHEQINKEWSISAHRWSAMDVAFQTVQEVMAKQNGPESTRYCGGCHDPISLFSGAKNIFNDDLTNLAGYQEGVSCLSCHGVLSADLQGNANYVMRELPRYMFELREGAPAKFVSDFLIRAYPRHHVESLSKRLFKTPEYCAACHKQFIDEEVNQVGWVQLQNQYDNWRKSRWNHPGDPERTIECRECHMPLVESTDPAAGDALDYNRSPDDGKHRSHRFLAANQLMPALLQLDGWEEQVELTRKWLRGEFEIPEIADKWPDGPAVPIEIVVPEQVEPGEDVTLRVNITSNKVGHDFPTGPLDIIQAWVEVIVTDSEGDVVFQSGTVDDQNFIEPGSFLFKAEPVDQYGNLIDRHNLWEMVGVRYRRSLFPGFADAAEFSFPCPSTLTSAEGEKRPKLDQETFAFQAPTRTDGELRVTARLRYRKVDQFLLNFLFGEDAGLTSPIADMSEDEAVIRVVNRS